MNETESDRKDFGFWLAALFSVALAIMILATVGIGVWWLFIKVAQSAGGC
jgi:hypothetical protein